MSLPTHVASSGKHHGKGPRTKKAKQRARVRRVVASFAGYRSRRDPAFLDHLARHGVTLEQVRRLR